MSTDRRFSELGALGISPSVAEALANAVQTASDNELARINPLVFAKARGLDENEVIGAFLRASKLGLFDHVWSVHCARCTGMLASVTSARELRGHHYYCTACDLNNEPSLDARVEVTFAVNPRVRKLAEAPSPLEVAQRAFSSSVQLDEQQRAALKESLVDLFELLPDARKTLVFEVAGPVSVVDITMHGAASLVAEGAPTRDEQEISVSFDGHPARRPFSLRPGPVSLTIENRSPQRMVILAHRLTVALHDAFSKRAPFLAAKRLFTHPVFRELYRTTAIDVSQRLKIESLTVLFTDLKGSTELYDRVGDLTAFELVRKHFEVLEAAVAAEGGSVVKTIGDAVMAAFAEPRAAMAAALRMRDGLAEFNQRGASDLLIKIGLHDGPCLAVMLNERLDYFGQTVNIAARVQGIAAPQAVLATQPVLRAEGVARLLEEQRLTPSERQAELKGVTGAMTVYEIA